MRRITLAVTILTVLGLAVPAGATTTRTEISGTSQVVAQLDPGESWLSDGTLHVRGQKLLGIQTPDPGTGLPTGTVHVTVNFNLDTATFNGRAWGSGDISYGDGGFITTFRGDIRPSPTGPIGEFRVVGHGYGSLEGAQLRATAIEMLATGFSTFEGVIFVPGDR